MSNIVTRMVDKKGILLDPRWQWVCICVLSYVCVKRHLCGGRLGNSDLAVHKGGIDRGKSVGDEEYRVRKEEGTG